MSEESKAMRVAAIVTGTLMLIGLVTSVLGVTALARWVF